jgi:hypothetical protein
MRGQQDKGEGAVVGRDLVEKGVRLLTSAKPAERERGYRGLRAAGDAVALLDLLSARLYRAWQSRRGEAKDRALAALQLVLTLSVAAEARQDVRRRRHRHVAVLAWQARMDAAALLGGLPTSPPSGG